MANAFNFELVSPERLLLSEEVTQVVVPGADGYLTVMANHAPMMTTLAPGIVETTDTGGANEKIFVRGGFADISPAGFTLLAEEATNVKDIDASYIEQQIKDAEEDVADAQNEDTKQAASFRLARLQEVKTALGH
ncbi:MAG: F0F1 ATP synthase subunit epsilon [Pseudomonadota bacterium]